MRKPSLITQGRLWGRRAPWEVIRGRRGRAGRISVLTEAESTAPPRGRTLDGEEPLQRSLCRRPDLRLPAPDRAQWVLVRPVCGVAAPVLGRVARAGRAVWGSALSEGLVRAQGLGSRVRSSCGHHEAASAQRAPTPRPGALAIANPRGSPEEARSPRFSHQRLRPEAQQLVTFSQCGNAPFSVPGCRQGFPRGRTQWLLTSRKKKVFSRWKIRDGEKK